MRQPFKEWVFTEEQVSLHRHVLELLARDGMPSPLERLLIDAWSKSRLRSWVIEEAESGRTGTPEFQGALKYFGRDRLALIWKTRNENSSP